MEFTGKAVAPTSEPGGGGASLDASTAPAPLATSATSGRPDKVIVAVHGVGDQYSFATIQSVVNQFCTFFRQPAAVPLGSFHAGTSPFSISPPYDKNPFGRLHFAEVYWAKIPREVVDDKHTMEESKRWARTIVERLRMRWRNAGRKGQCRERDFDTIKLVLTEMIQTIAVLERLCFVADRAGVFTFDLRKLLDDYLGDVQIVAEFSKQREDILTVFDKIMTDVHHAHKDADIYIIAHSEGTVVSLLGILAAGRAERMPAWLPQVRGFMTIGSPIDKHLILWPELFEGAGPKWTRAPGQQIQWRNYYDRGDPIGFSLDDARKWLTATGWDQVLKFTDADDFGFDRYPFPGKAHVDYWTDQAVFGHFIQNVVNEAVPERPTAEFSKPPSDITWKKWLSYIIPYVGVAAVLFLGLFILYKAVIRTINPSDASLQSTSVIVRSVAGTTLLLLGITIATRIPRLANTLWWKFRAAVLLVLFVVAFALVAQSGQTIRVFGDTVESGWKLNVLASLVIGGLAWLATANRPEWGLKPLIVIGTLSIAGVVSYHVYAAKSVGDIGPIWPVFLATVAFLYLWWLSALFFDLVFVWHVHIRQDRALARLDELIGTPWGSARPVVR